jgi:hypothetical protein
VPGTLKSGSDEYKPFRNPLVSVTGRIDARLKPAFAATKAMQPQGKVSISKAPHSHEGEDGEMFTVRSTTGSFPREIFAIVRSAFMKL